MGKMIQKTIFLILIAFFLVSCDWVRKKLDMPTSEQIAEKREQIAQIEKDREQTSQKEQINTAESVAKSESSNNSEPTQSVENEENLQYKYYIVVGSFANPANAERMKKKMEKEQILDKPFTYKRSDGLTLVAIGRYKSWQGASVALNDVKYLIEDAWIYKIR